MGAVLGGRPQRGRSERASDKRQQRLDELTSVRGASLVVSELSPAWPAAGFGPCPNGTSDCEC